MENSNKNKNSKNRKKFLKRIKSQFRKNAKHKFFDNQDFRNKIENHELFNNVKIKKLNNHKLFIRLCGFALDTKNSDLLNYLYNKDIKKNSSDIIREIYKINYLSTKRFEFLLEEKNNTIIVSSQLIRNLIRKNEIDMLNVLFKYSKFYDNEIILEFCYLYRYKKSLSTVDIKNKISNEKYSIETNYNGNYLHNACDKGHEPIVKYLVEHGADVNQKIMYSDMTPLLYACYHGYQSIVKYLVEHGANVNQARYSPDIPYASGKDGLLYCILEHGGDTPLIIACNNKNKAIIKYLVEHGADINQRNYSGCTPLINACKDENEALVKYLIEHGADVNRENEDHDSPLIIACEKQNETIVKYLVEHGADVNKENEDHDSPLIIACENKNETIVKYLVEHGADVNKGSYYNDDTPLILACLSENETIVKYLVEHGADLNKMNKSGGTSLSNACLNGNENIIKYLIERGADINKGNHTPLVFSIRKGDEVMVKHLIELGADIHATGVLVEACNSENENIIKYLIERGVDVNQKDYSDCTPLLAACEKENEFLVRYLVEHGANVNQFYVREKLHYDGYYRYYMNYTDTPLKIACRNGNEALVQYLVEHGANVNMYNPLDDAVENGNENIIRYLCEHGVSLIKRDRMGNKILVVPYEDEALHEILIDYTDKYFYNLNNEGYYYNLPKSKYFLNGNESFIKDLVDFDVDIYIKFEKNRKKKLKSKNLKINPKNNKKRCLNKSKYNRQYKIMSDL